MSRGRPTRLVWNVPNVISACRLASVPMLVGMEIAGARGAFTWLLLAALLSDIADGLIARTFDLRTEAGAFLDSTADALLTGTAIAGLFVFQRPVLADHAVGLGTVIGAYGLGTAAALLKYGKLAGFHTYLCRIAAYAQGIWIMSLFFWGFQRWICATMVGISLVAYAEEIAMILLLRRARADARGLPWVLRR